MIGKSFPPVGLLAWLISATVLQAAPDTVDTVFAASAGQVYDDSDFGSAASILVQPDGKILVGSNEMRTSLNAPNFLEAPLIRFNPDGTVDNTFFADNDPNGAGTGINFIGSGWPEVMALDLQSDGKIIAGGVMTGMNDGTTNVSPSNSLVRINANGTADPTFQNSGLTNTASGNLNYVEDLFVEADDKIFLAGSFGGVRSLTYVTTTRYGLARLNADGSLDTTFQIDPSQFGVPAGASAVRGSFYQASRDASGRYYIAGALYWSGGFTHVLARLFPNGQRDTSFAPTGLPNALWTGVAIDQSGKITAIGQVDFQPSTIVRLNPDGSPDPAFVFPGFGAFAARPLQFDAAGRFLLYSQGGTTLQRFLANGAIDPTFTVAAGIVDTPHSTAYWNTFTVAPSGKIYAGGFFNRANGVDTVKIVAFEGDAAPDAFAFKFAGASIVENAGTVKIGITRTGSASAAGSVAFATTNGSALAGTHFTASSGTLTWAAGEAGTKFITIPITNNLSLDGDKVFSLSLSSPTGGTISGAASANITIQDDEAPPVILTHPVSVSAKQGFTATFSVTASSPVPPAFQWFKDGEEMPGKTSSILVLTNIGPDDEADYTVSITASGPSAPSNPATLTVIPPSTTLDPAYNPTGIDTTAPITYLPDGSLFAINGSGTNFSVVKYDATGTAVSTWPFTFTIQSGYFPSLSLLTLPTGKFLITGNFTVINGVSRNRIARLNADGSVDETFNAGLDAPNSGSLSGLTVTPSGRVYLRWRPQLQSGGLRRLLDSGAADPAFVTTLTDGTSGFLYALTELTDDSLLIGHTSGSPGNLTRGLVKLTETGAAFPGFNVSNSLFPEPRFIVPLPDGRFIVARNTVLEIRLANGDLDPSFSLAGTFVGNINSLAYHRGRIVIAGPTTFNGLAIPGLARFSLTGQWDDNFPAGTGPTGGFVQTFAVDSQGRLLVRGTFTAWNGVARNRLARLLLTANEVAFTTPALRVLETAGTLAVEVVRFGDPAAAASVRVTTAAGTAASPGDFSAVDQTLNWAPGDSSSKTINVAILDDETIDGDLTFTLSLSEPAGVTLATSQLTVTLTDDDSLPKITAQPAVVLVPAGFAASFTVASTSPTTQTYQWYKDGVLIAGQTSATYNIASAALANEGAHHVVITNAYGTATSSAALLVIVPSPFAVPVGFTVSPPFSALSSAMALALAPDGGVYVGGSFLNVNNEAPRDYLVKLLPAGGLDTGFNPVALNGSVNDIVVQPDGKIVVAGSFNTVDGVSRRGIARFETTGALDSTFATNVGTGTNGDASAVAVLSDGKIVLGGSFTSWKGVSLNPNRDLIRLNADGTLDGAYPKTTTSFVRDLIVLPGDAILAAIDTTSSSAVKVARYLADRTLDNTFNYGNGRTRVHRMSLAADGDYLFASVANNPGAVFKVDSTGTPRPGFSLAVSQVNTVRQQLNGKFITGGTSAKRIDRFLTTGAVDPTFAPATGFDGNVERILVRPDGKIWVSGAFSNFNGSAAPRVILLNGDAIPLAITGQPAALVVEPAAPAVFTVQTTALAAVTYQWRKNGTPLADGTNITGTGTAQLQIASAEEADEGNYTCVVSNLYGTETTQSASLTVLGAPEITVLSGNVNQVEGSGFTLNASVSGAATLTYQWKRNNIALENGPRISGATGLSLTITPSVPGDSGTYTFHATNSFDSVPSVPISVNILENQAAIVPGFTSPPINTIVRQVFPLPNGKVLIGGDFAASGEHGARLRVINPDGSVHPAPGLSADGIVYAIRQAADGKILVAGNFNYINGQLRRRVARLEADLTLDESFDASTGFGEFGGLVLDVAQESSGTILAVGQFADFNADPAADYAVRLTSTGAHDTSFVSGSNSFVYRVLPQADGGAVFLGWFSAWAGNTSGGYVARTNPSGGFDGTLYSSGALFTGDGLDLGAGAFIAAGGFSGTAYQYNADGSKDGNFLSEGAANASIAGLARDALGRFLLGGNFTNITGANRNRLVRLNPGGTRDDTFAVGTGLNGAVEDIAIAADGSIWVAGNFTNYNGTAVTHLVRLKGQPATAADPFADYLIAAGVPENLRGETDDADFDGIANLIEYLYQTGPANGGERPQPFTGSSIQSGASIAGADPLKNYRVIQVVIPKDLLGLTVEVQVATDLTDFGTGPGNATEFGTPTDNGATETRSYYLTPATEDASELFWRLGVSR